MQETLLILGAGSLQVPAIQTARRMGLRVVVLDGDRSAPGLQMGDTSLVVDITNAEVCLDIARRENVDGIIQICSEVSMWAWGRINEELGLSGPNLATMVRATNKEKMRRAFEAGGAPSPRSFGAATEADALCAARQIEGALIVKPSRNSGSRGVTRVDSSCNRGQLIEAFRRALGESRDNSTVIEEFIEGPEFSVEILAWDGMAHVLAVTDKVTTGAPFFVETGHSQPTRFTDGERKTIEQAAIAGVHALGLDWTAAHAEVRLSPRGPFLMEIGARLGGDFITTELVHRSTGIDMVEGAIRLALGKVPDLVPRHPRQGACIRYLTPLPGRIVAIEGVERARAMPGVKIVEVSAKPGDMAPEVTSSLARIGYVIAEGTSAEQAIAAAERACDAVIISIEARCDGTTTTHFTEGFGQQ